MTPSVAAKSAGVAFAAEEAALRVAVKFGPRPAGVRCPAAVFAVPLDSARVAVVQVADVPGPGDPLAFRFLVLGRPLYDALGDPFAIADRFPPDWAALGQLGDLAWPPAPLPPRTVADVRDTLKTGDSPLLLGATQALLDGSRLLLVRAEPASDSVRGVWQLLPDRSRIDLWPATFAFAADLGFHVVVLPAPPTEWPVGYLTEEQTRDYPEGRYELAVQIAAESGDQAALDALFARRSSRDTLRLAAFMVAFAFAAAIVLKFV